MRLLRLSPLVWSCALVACTASPGLRPAASGQAPQGRAPVAPGPAAKPDAAALPDLGPSLVANNGAAGVAPVAAATDAGATAAPGLALARGVALPLRILPALPAALVGTQGAALLRDSRLLANDGAALVVQDGGALIANDGAGIISNDGGGLIANDGAGVVAGGAGNRRVLARYGLMTTEAELLACLGPTPDPSASGGAQGELGASQPAVDWESRVTLEVQDQATRLMSQAYCIDQLLARWAASKPRLGRWGRFTARLDTFLDRQALESARDAGPERHFVALARAEEGALAVAMFAVATATSQPEARGQVLWVRARAGGPAEVVFSGEGLYPSQDQGVGAEGAATGPFAGLLAPRIVHNARFRLQGRELLGESAMAYYLGSGAAGHLYSYRQSWALSRAEGGGLSLASSQAHHLGQCDFAYQNQFALKALADGRGVFWTREGLDWGPAALRDKPMVYVPHGADLPRVPSPAAELSQVPAWFVTAEGGVPPVPPSELLGQLPGQDAAASAPMPQGPRVPAEGLVFPFGWSPSRAEGEGG